MNEIARDPPTSQAKSKSRRGRRPKVPLLKSVELAYGHLHDLDWLQECALADLPEVREQANAHQFMPEAQALRRLLVQAGQQVIKDIETVPSLAGTELFLVRYLEGKRVVDIARELGVSREWASRHFRKSAFKLAGMQFIRNVSVGHLDSAAGLG